LRGFRWPRTPPETPGPWLARTSTCARPPAGRRSRRPCCRTSPPATNAQAVAGDRGALGAVARDATHVKWSGRIEMVREGGAWKLDDETWSSEHR
jgi:hypothetical protein